MDEFRGARGEAAAARPPAAAAATAVNSDIFAALTAISQFGNESIQPEWQRWYK